MNIKSAAFFCLLALIVLLSSCGGIQAETPSPSRLKIGVVIDLGGEKDRSFNEYTLKGAQKAAAEAGLELTHTGSKLDSDYGQNIEDQVSDGADMIITVGFRSADATARAAQKYPDIKFAIMDSAFFPGSGCPNTVADCYTAEGGLANVTSLMFAEDEVAYLAGVLAACMSQTGTIASVAGMEIPPVVRFVTGYQNGARSVKPDIVALNQYIPDFNDPDTGKVVAQGFIQQGADVLFGAGGNTGNGALIAAAEAGLMAIGVDVDQYYTYPEAKAALLTSASKNVDIAAGVAVKEFAEGKLTAGIRTATLANGGVGLAPYHDWDEKIPAVCKEQVDKARAAVIANPEITGAK